MVISFKEKKKRAAKLSFIEVAASYVLILIHLDSNFSTSSTNGNEVAFHHGF